MNDYGRRGANDRAAGVEQAKVQVAILAPGGGESFIETADCFQRVTATKAVGRNELALLKTRRVPLIVRRTSRQWNDGLPCDGNYAGIGKWDQARGEPAAVGDTIVV